MVGRRLPIQGNWPNQRGAIPASRAEPKIYINNLPTIGSIRNSLLVSVFLLLDLPRVSSTRGVSLTRNRSSRAKA
jgi:hypothetical protein